MGWCHPIVPVVCEGCRDASAAVRSGCGESGVLSAFLGCSLLAVPSEAQKNWCSALKPSEHG